MTILSRAKWHAAGARMGGVPSAARVMRRETVSSAPVTFAKIRIARPNALAATRRSVSRARILTVTSVATSSARTAFSHTTHALAAALDALPTQSSPQRAWDLLQKVPTFLLYNVRPAQRAARAKAARA